jgi:hypothetical protein
MKLVKQADFWPIAGFSHEVVNFIVMHPCGLGTCLNVPMRMRTKIFNGYISRCFDHVK